MFEDQCKDISYFNPGNRKVYGGSPLYRKKGRRPLTEEQRKVCNEVKQFFENLRDRENKSKDSVSGKSGEDSSNVEKSQLFEISGSETKSNQLESFTDRCITKLEKNKDKNRCTKTTLLEPREDDLSNVVHLNENKLSVKVCGKRLLSILDTGAHCSVISGKILT